MLSLGKGVQLLIDQDWLSGSEAGYWTHCVDDFTAWSVLLGIGSFLFDFIWSHGFGERSVGGYSPSCLCAFLLICSPFFEATIHLVKSISDLPAEDNKRYLSKCHRLVFVRFVLAAE